jgi:mannose/fructose-specific phosphotransferase system component IIA
MSGEGSYEWERTEKLLMTEIIGGSVVKLTWTIMEQKPSYWIMMNQASLIVTCER